MTTDAEKLSAYARACLERSPVLGFDSHEEQLHFMEREPALPTGFCECGASWPCPTAALARMVLALAEALEDVTDAGCAFSDPRVKYEEWQIPRGAMEKAQKVIAAAAALIPEGE